MQLPLQITFRDFASSDFIRDYVEKRAAKLEKFFDRIISCRVVVEAPNRGHHRHGSPFRVLIDVSVPGQELVVGRRPDDEPSHKDLYAAIDSSFDDMRRMLEEWARKRRGEVKHHGAPA